MVLHHHRFMSRRGFLGGSAGIAALALAPSLLTTTPAAARSTDARIVNANGVRLRTAPGTGSGVIASLASGTVVRYLEYGGWANGYEWHKVRVESSGREGFVAAIFLSAPDPGGGTGRPRVQVAAGPLRLRSAPGTGSTVLRTVPTGARGEVTTQMPVTKDGYVWVNVWFYDYGTGWVAKNFLTWL